MRELAQGTLTKFRIFFWKGGQMPFFQCFYGVVGRIQEPQRRRSGNAFDAIQDNPDETSSAGTALRSVAAYKMQAGIKDATRVQ